MYWGATDNATLIVAEKPMWYTGQDQQEISKISLCAIRQYHYVLQAPHPTKTCVRKLKCMEQIIKVHRTTMQTGRCLQCLQFSVDNHSTLKHHVKGGAGEKTIPVVLLP